MKENFISLPNNTIVYFNSNIFINVKNEFTTKAKILGRRNALFINSHQNFHPFHPRQVCLEIIINNLWYGQFWSLFDVKLISNWYIIIWLSFSYDKLSRERYSYNHHNWYKIHTIDRITKRFILLTLNTNSYLGNRLLLRSNLIMKADRPEWLIAMHLNDKPCSILRQSMQNYNLFPF